MNYRMLLVLLCCVLPAHRLAAVLVEEINIEQKTKRCQDLVEDAIGFFKKESLSKACRSFMTDPKWRAGEIMIFVFDSGGVCHVFGNQKIHIWKDFQTKKTIAEEDFIAQMLEVGQGGGEVHFVWDNSYMQAHVRTVRKQGVTYIIGAGFYPDSGKYVCEQLVRSAVAYGATIGSSKVLFERISNPQGMFVKGEIYLYAYDFSGVCVAHGKSLELIGQNLLNEVTPDGKRRTYDIIQIAKSRDGQGWYRYASRQGGVEKLVYVERYTDKNGKKYAIVGGYYPTINEDDVRTMVRKAVSYLRTNGTKLAFAEFSRPLGEFAYGSIALFVYDTKGTIVADMENPAFVGQNLMNAVDADGRPIAQLVLQQAERYGNGWLSFHLKHAYAMMYVEQAKVPEGSFVIGALYYPTGKKVAVRFMVEKAARYLEQHDKGNAFDQFASMGSDFLRGDVFVTVYDEKGTILVDGIKRDSIWGDDSAIRDEKGIAITSKVISRALSGGGWVTARRYGAPCKIYAKEVFKEGPSGSPELDERFIVTSCYYL